jgi:glucan phosphoethanolaminetransferase (alkaline phosphatase superfamily)
MAVILGNKKISNRLLTWYVFFGIFLLSVVLAFLTANTGASDLGGLFFGFSLVSLIGYTYIFICLLIASAAQKKGRNYQSFLILSLILGPIIMGFVVAVIGDKNTSSQRDTKEDLTDDQRKCKYCAELIKKDAIFCKHCKNNLN